MRIAYVCTDPGIPVFGNKGASIHVRALSTELHRAGHDVRILACRAGGDPPADFTVPTVEFPLEAPERALLAELRSDPDGGDALASPLRTLLYGATARSRMLPVLRRFRPDVIYERYALFGTTGSELAAALDVPHLLEVNAPLSDEHAAHRGGVPREAARAVERRVLTRADVVLPVSTELRSWLIAVGVDPRRIEVTPNGVDFARFQAGGADMRARHGLGTRPTVGFVGTLKPWHGTATLLRAAGRLAREHGRDGAPVLLVVGDGPERPALEALAAAEGIAGHVVFAGAVAHEEVPAYLAAMDVAVAPYDETPGFYFSPLKLFEYMAAGRAVVAARIGQIEDLLRDGETGVLYPPGDDAALAARLGALLARPAERRRLGAAARAEARAHHGWDRNARVVIARIERARAARAGSGARAGLVGAV